MLRRFLLFGFAVALSLVGVLCLFAFLQLVNIKRKIVVSPQTTVITTPLAKDGLPDYEAYFLNAMDRFVPPEDNAAIPFLLAVWPCDLSPADQKLIADELGFTPPNRPSTMQLNSEATWSNFRTRRKADVDVFDSQKSNGIIDQSQSLDEVPITPNVTQLFNPEILKLQSAILSRPWTRAELPFLAEFIDSKSEQYDLIYEAASRPRYYLPSPELLNGKPDSVVTMSMSHISFQRQVSRAMAGRTLLRIGEKDYDGAWQDCKTALLFFENIESVSLVEELVQIACIEHALDTIASLCEQPIPKSLAIEIRDFLLTMPQRDSMIGSIDQFERILGIDFLINATTKRMDVKAIALEAGISSQTMSRMPLDTNRVLQKLNSQYDEMMKTFDAENLEQRAMAIDKYHSALESRDKNRPSLLSAIFSNSSRTDFATQIFSEVFSPTAVEMVVGEDRCNTELQLVTTAAAIAAYRADHNGDCPSALTDLVPNYLPELLLDKHLGRPLVYHRFTEGYLLYSVGHNGIDEFGGNSSRHTIRGYQIPTFNPAIDQRFRDLLRRHADESSGQMPPIGTADLNNQIIVDSDDQSVVIPSFIE